MGLLKTDLSPQTTFFLITAFIQIPIYTGLGAYVLSQRPRHPINWAFAGYCATNVISLAGSIFMIGLSGLTPLDRPLPMRVKWAVVPLFGTFLFHLYSFYFPQGWQRVVRYVVWLIYATAITLALVTLFTDRVVAGLLMKETAIHPNVAPGSLFTPLVLFNNLLYFAAAATLVYTYFASTSRIRRRHIRELLLPLFLIIVITFITVPTLFSEDQIYWMTRLNHVLLLVTAVIYGRNILQYGHFVERPQSTARLISILVLSFITFIVATGLWLIESWLSQYMPVRLPLLVLLVTVIIIAALPELSRAFSRVLRRLYYSPQHDHHEQIATNIAAELEKVHDPAEIQKTLLQETCETLSARGGFVAYLHQESGKFRISTTYGLADVAPGDELLAPPFSLRRPKLLTAAASWLQEQPIWQAIVIVSPIYEENGPLIGFMALGERKNGRPYYHGDTTYCEEVCRRLAQIQRMASLLKEHEQVLQTVEAKTTEITKIQDALDTPPIQPKPAVKIYTLGPLKIELEDDAAVDHEFNSEKVKSMLALLLLRGEQGATRDELAATLWPDHEPDKVDNVFHVTLHKLRRTLEPNRSSRGSDYVILKDGRYQLNFSKPIWLDADHFEQLIMSEEIEDWREAVALYRGDYLQGLRDEMPLDIQYKRRRLESLYESGLRNLVDCLGAEEEGYDYLLALYKQNPVDERVNKELIDYYMNQGQLSQARQQVVRWRDELERLSLVPSAEILAFWRRVENGNGRPASSD